MGLPKYLDDIPGAPSTKYVLDKLKACGVPISDILDLYYDVGEYMYANNIQIAGYQHDIGLLLYHMQSIMLSLPYYLDSDSKKIPSLKVQMQMFNKNKVLDDIVTAYDAIYKFLQEKISVVLNLVESHKMYFKNNVFQFFNQEKHEKYKRKAKSNANKLSLICREIVLFILPKIHPFYLMIFNITNNDMQTFVLQPHVKTNYLSKLFEIGPADIKDDDPEPDKFQKPVSQKHADPVTHRKKNK